MEQSRVGYEWWERLQALRFQFIPRYFLLLAKLRSLFFVQNSLE